jgi:hypothetical protein
MGQSIPPPKKSAKSSDTYASELQTTGAPAIQIKESDKSLVMELSRLASKQKRYRDILLFTEEELTDPQLKPKLLTTLAAYRLALADCWKKQAVTADDVTAIDSVERDLESLYNHARLRTASK